jgi:hypothetical protein
VPKALTQVGARNSVQDDCFVLFCFHWKKKMLILESETRGDLQEVVLEGGW